MWQFLTDNIFSYFGITDLTVVQDLVISSILIPVVLLIFTSLKSFYLQSRPLKKLFKGFDKEDVYVFLTQLNAADKDGKLIEDQRYLVKYPSSTPKNKDRIMAEGRQNIDPVWAESDGTCLADVYNALGKAGITDNLIVGSLLQDFNKRSTPMISIGFNPKSHFLKENCSPIYYDFVTVKPGVTAVKIKGKDLKVKPFWPYDAGIIQKTFTKDSNKPVFILAGLGTLGTNSAGYFFKTYASVLGKLFGDDAFCVLFKSRWDEGKASFQIAVVYPEPHWTKAIMYPVVYWKFKKGKLFPSSK